MLRSLKKFFKEYETSKIYVIYKADKDYDYGKVKLLYPRVRFEEEKSFKEQVLSKLSEEYTMFECDDDVFIRPFSLEDKELKVFSKNHDIMTISLRLDEVYDYCWDSDNYMRIPKFDSDNAWHWAGQDLDWGYPMSVLGNVFRTKELRPYLEKLDFTGPNTLEGSMAVRPLPNPRMMFFGKARCVNMPLNLVQKVALNNRALDISPVKINKEFQKGKVIDLDYILTKIDSFNSCFSPLEIRWKLE